MSVLQPIGQVRLTNVAYVRLAKGGKRFEIACYRNKVLNWRNKIEQDINEVLQVASVFTNVSKGTHASSKDLQQAFGTTDHLKVCEEILEKGDLQVSEKEREAMLESMFRDVASLVCEMTINPENGRQYSLSMIQNAMKQIHFSVNLRSAKKQALDVIRKLRPVMSIVRAGMLVRLVFRPNDAPAIDSMLDVEAQYVTVVKRHVSESTEDAAGDAWVEVRIDPEVYRRLEDAVKLVSEGIGRVEIMQLRVSLAGGSEPPPVNDDQKCDEEETVVLARECALTNENKIKPSSTSGETYKDDSDGDSDTSPGMKNLSAKDKKKEKKKKTKEERRATGLDTFSPALIDETGSAMAAVTAVAVDAIDLPPPPETIVGKKCNTCGGSFASDSDYRVHFRSEWHRYNLKRKMKNLPIVSEMQFGTLPPEEIARTTDSTS